MEKRAQHTLVFYHMHSFFTSDFIRIRRLYHKFLPNEVLKFSTFYQFFVSNIKYKRAVGLLKQKLNFIYANVAVSRCLFNS